MDHLFPSVFVNAAPLIAFLSTITSVTAFSNLVFYATDNPILVCMMEGMIANSDATFVHLPLHERISGNSVCIHTPLQYGDIYLLLGHHLLLPLDFLALGYYKCLYLSFPLYCYMPYQLPAVTTFYRCYT